MRDGIVKSLIDDALLDRKVKEAELTLAPEDAVARIELNLKGQLARQFMTREDYAERLEAGSGLSLAEVIDEQANDPGVRQSLLQVRWLELEYADEVAVTDEDVSESYQQNLGMHTQPARVRASHILIGTEGVSTEEGRAEARAKADALVADARAEGADFAALAKEHSTGPSGPNGGDLGFFPRNGVMVEPFAAAAFELDVGQVSDVVETQFGYHIIQVTEREDEKVRPLSECADWIRAELELERVTAKRESYLEEARASAKIEYAPAS